MASVKAHLGLPEKKIEKSVFVLSHYLSDTYYLYLKTHNFHWNVTGMHFYAMHKMFEEQYTALFTSVDEIAERIRAFGHFVPATTEQFKAMTSLKETKKIPNSREMVEMLKDDHEKVVQNLRKWIAELLAIDDNDTSDFLTGRMKEHEKTAWMLRSHLDK